MLDAVNVFIRIMIKIQVDKNIFKSPVNNKFITGYVNGYKNRKVNFKLGIQEDDGYYDSDDYNTEFKYFEGCEFQTYDRRRIFISIRIYA